MDPYGRTRICEKYAAKTAQMALKRKFPALFTRLEYQSRDQTRHCANNFRTFRSSEGKSAGSPSNYIRCSDHSARQRGSCRTPEFWSFSNQRRAGRVGRNPRTGDVVNVPPRCFVSFKPGKEMDARVRELDEPQSS